MKYYLHIWIIISVLRRWELEFCV